MKVQEELPEKEVAYTDGSRIEGYTAAANTESTFVVRYVMGMDAEMLAIAMG